MAAVQGLVSTFAGLCLVLAELLSHLRRGEGMLPLEIPSSGGIDQEEEIQ